MLGFEKIADMLNSFSIEKLFTDAVEYVYNLIEKMLNFDFTSLLPD
jgi:hypothetical protein